ncbi:amidase [Microbacterium endophyticum]|uniref:Amidase n=1 Tax=Microbacterium endophyticum TaxID=1526412 RepID=A0A7W4YNZ5_9MICO|nr:amidase [Microbacterium endophyticum]MBB2976226.1 amidase [Microbacterium endophyticum]NIK35106.1 amidase [Microbacterium endophyticum]
MTQLHELSARELGAAMRAGSLRPSDVTAHYLARIERSENTLGVFTEITADSARQRAEGLEAARAAETSVGALWGMPLADKDLVARRGVRTRYGSKSRANYVPESSDPLALALDDADAVSLGKTNTPEFGLTGYTEPELSFPARDPWNPENGAGGSSGGAAVAVAAGLLPFAPASDGGGSIRIPAATVGVVGLKPSRGRLALGSGFDGPGGLVVTGPIARSVDDAAYFLDAMTSFGVYRYATRANDGAPFSTATSPVSRAKMLRIGVTTVSPWDDDEEIVLDAAASSAVQAAAELFTNCGDAVSELSWHPRGYAEMFRTLWRASAARIPLSDDDLLNVEPITAWLVREGRALGAVALLDALAAATRFEQDTAASFAPYDVVLTPALAQSPRPVGWYDPVNAERNFAQQVRYAPYSSFVNVAGLPALVLPLTTDAAGHPVSVQLIGRPGGERDILAAAARLEQQRGVLRHPPGW